MKCKQQMKAYPNNIASLMETQEMDTNCAIDAQTIMTRSKIKGFRNKRLFTCMVIDTYDEMMQMTMGLADQGINPLVSAIQSVDHLDGDWITKMGAICSDYMEFQSRLSKLQQEINEANAKVAKIVANQLRKDIPKLHELQALAVEDRKNMVQEWKDAEMLMDGLQPVYEAIRAEFDAIKMVFENGIQNPINQMGKGIGDDATNAQENQSD